MSNILKACAAALAATAAVLTATLFAPGISGIVTSPAEAAAPGLRLSGYAAPRLAPPPSSRTWNPPALFQNQWDNRVWFKRNMHNNSNLAHVHVALDGSSPDNPGRVVLKDPQQARDAIAMEAWIENKAVLRITGAETDPDERWRIRFTEPWQWRQFRAAVRDFLNSEAFVGGFFQCCPGNPVKDWIDHLQIWNEPNGNRFGPYCTGGSGNIQQFQPVFNRGVLGAVDTGFPRSRIISPGYAPVERCGRTWQQQVNHIGSHGGFESYGKTGAHIYPGPGENFNQKMNPHLNASGRNIFVTEWGACVAVNPNDEHTLYNNGCATGVWNQTEEGQRDSIQDWCARFRNISRVRAALYWHPYHHEDARRARDPVFNPGGGLVNRGMSLLRSSLSGYAWRPGFTATRGGCNTPWTAPNTPP